MRIIRRLFGLAFKGIAVALLALVAYEAFTVGRAMSRTEAVRAEYLKEPFALKVADLPEERLDILLAVEDPAFFDHSGIDFGSPGQGMTTITQGLTKFMYFERFQPGFAKIEQSLIAWLVVDRSFTKEEQLTILLNHAYLGNEGDRSIRGFAEGARHWFNKPLEALDNDEYIGLVGMLIGPNALTPGGHQSAHIERVSRIKRLLAGTCRPNGVFDPWLEPCGAAADA